MRETRTSGSEGGGYESAPYPYVRLRAHSIQGGASPLQVNPIKPVAERNCVTARWGGEQREAMRSSVAKANSIRPC
jgi:hypothetical protein